MISNCKYNKSGEVKGTMRSDKSFSVWNGIWSPLSSIVFYQLTFSKHKGFPGSGAPAGIWRKRYKLYRFLFFEENTFDNQKCFCTWNNESDFSLSNAKLFPAELLGTINNSRNSAFGENNICWKMLRHRNNLTFKVILPFFYSLCEEKKGCFGKL